VIGVGTIRFRLTAAYALLLSVMVGGTAVWSWIAARQSLSVTVDRSLERDLALFQTNVGQVLHFQPDILKAIQMSSTSGGRDLRVRVFDANGVLVYQSTSLENEIQTRPPDVDRQMRECFETSADRSAGTQPCTHRDPHPRSVRQRTAGHRVGNPKRPRLHRPSPAVH
jgi:hypothetical protein